VIAEGWDVVAGMVEETSEEADWSRDMGVRLGDSDATGYRTAVFVGLRCSSGTDVCCKYMCETIEDDDAVFINVPCC
jgi:hypothetical protein